MKRFLLAPLVVLLSSNTFADTAATTPDDISKFIARREHCENIRPSNPNNDEHSKEARDQKKPLNSYCNGIDKELRVMREKYRDDPALVEKLSKYDKLNQ